MKQQVTSKQFKELKTHQFRQWIDYIKPYVHKDDPTDYECPTIKQMIKFLGHDNSKNICDALWEEVKKELDWSELIHNQNVF